MRVADEVPRRRGWEFGALVQEGTTFRQAVIHRPSRRGLWVTGRDPAERLAATHTAIDGLYEGRWRELADLIEEGDRRGPNVHLIE